MNSYSKRRAAPRCAGVVVAGLLLAVALATRTSAQAPAGGGGLWADGRSGLQIQNIDLRPASLVANFYDAAGRLAMQDVKAPLAPGAAYNFYLPLIPEVAQGGYALAVSSDGNLAAINRTDDVRSGAAVMYSNAMPSRQTVVPLVMKDFAGQTSLVSLFNSDADAAAQVRVEIYRAGVSNGIKDSVLSVQRVLAPGASTELNFAEDPGLGAVPDGFWGWLMVSSSTPLAVQASNSVGLTARAAAAVEGQPVSLASDTLVFPLVRRNYGGTTGIAVVNPAFGAAVEATLSFHGLLGTCAGQSYTQGPARIESGSGALFYQASGAQAATGASPLPDGCAGSAVLRTAGGGRLLATVQDVSPRDFTAAAYAGQALSQGAGRVGLPLIRNHHTKADLVTGIMAMNVGRAPAHALIRFFDQDGALVPGGADHEAVIPPFESHLWWPPAMSGIGARSDLFGSALVEGDQPLAVVVVDASLNRRSDTVEYTGVPADGRIWPTTELAADPRASIAPSAGAWLALWPASSAR